MITDLKCVKKAKKDNTKEYYLLTLTLTLGNLELKSNRIFINNYYKLSNFDKAKEMFNELKEDMLKGIKVNEFFLKWGIIMPRYDKQAGYMKQATIYKLKEKEKAGGNDVSIFEI